MKNWPQSSCCLEVNFIPGNRFEDFVFTAQTLATTKQFSSVSSRRVMREITSHIILNTRHKCTPSFKDDHVLSCFAPHSHPHQHPHNSFFPCFYRGRYEGKLLHILLSTSAICKDGLVRVTASSIIPVVVCYRRCKSPCLAYYYLRFLLVYGSCKSNCLHYYYPRWLLVEAILKSNHQKSNYIR